MAVIEGEPADVAVFLRKLEAQSSWVRPLPGPMRGRRVLVRGVSPLWLVLHDQDPVSVEEETVTPAVLFDSFSAFYGALPMDQHEWAWAFDEILQLVVEHLGALHEVEVMAVLNAARDELPVSALLMPDMTVVGAVALAVTSGRRVEGLGLVGLTADRFVRAQAVPEGLWAGPWLK